MQAITPKPLELGEYIVEDVITNEIEALLSVNKFLRSQALPILRDFSQIGGPYASLESGKLQGPINKRIRKWLMGYNDKVVLPKDFNSKLGDLVSPFVIRKGIKVEVTDEFDWNAGDFGDAGSCFWGERSICREFMPAWGCRAILFSIPENVQQVGMDGRVRTNWIGAGRCWMYPLNGKETLYTSNDNTTSFPKPPENAWIAFNFYGLAESRALGLISHLFDWGEQRTVGFIASGPMYINRGTVTLFNPPPNVAFKTVHTQMGDNCYECDHCGKSYYDRDRAQLRPYGSRNCTHCSPRGHCSVCSKPVVKSKSYQPETNVFVCDLCDQERLEAIRLARMAIDSPLAKLIHKQITRDASEKMMNILVEDQA